MCHWPCTHYRCKEAATIETPYVSLQYRFNASYTVWDEFTKVTYQFTFPENLVMNEVTRSPNASASGDLQTIPVRFQLQHCRSPLFEPAGEVNVAKMVSLSSDHEAKAKHCCDQFDRFTN